MKTAHVPRGETFEESINNLQNPVSATKRRVNKIRMVIAKMYNFSVDDFIDQNLK